MGTRSLIIVRDTEGKTYVVIYQQFDGGPTVVGQEVYDYLKAIAIANSIPPGSCVLDYVNGPERLAANLVRCTEGCYLLPAGEGGVVDWTYEITVQRPQLKDGEQGSLKIKVTYMSGGEPEFEGSVSEFGAWIEDYKLLHN